MTILKELEAAGAVLLDQHFVYKSGKHGSGYINMDPIFPNIELMWQIGVELGGPFVESRVDAIVSPATGAIALAYATAYTWRYDVDFSSSMPAITAFWADKAGDDFVFERAGFADRLKGKRVLVVEDLLTTGGSVFKVSREAEKLGAEIVGVSAIINRGGVTAEQLGVPRLETLANVSFAALDPVNCELCGHKVPIVEDIGHGAEYKVTHPEYPGGYKNLL